MKNNSKLPKFAFVILLLVTIAGINVPHVAGSIQFTVEGYNLLPHEGWTTGNVKGYCEDDFVPIRLNYAFKSEPATTLVFRVGGDCYDEGEDAYGFDYFSEFTISGDYVSATVDYAGSPDGPYNFAWSGGPGTGEMIDLPGDRGLTVRYIIEVQVPAAGSTQKEFTIEFLAHESLTEFSYATIVKRGSYYWGSANLLVGKDPSDSGQNIISVKKCDVEPQPPTTTTTTSTTTTSDTTSSTTSTTTSTSSTTTSTTSATTTETSTTDTTTTDTTSSTTECPTVTETVTETVTGTCTDCTSTFTDCTNTITETITSTETVSGGTVTTTETIATTTTETSTVTTTELGSKIGLLGDNTYVIVGATDSVQGRGSKQPFGTRYASFIDATAVTIILGMSVNGQLFWDLDPKAVDQNTGAPEVGSTIVISGGPSVNTLAKYYEVNRAVEGTPVYFKVDGGEYYWFKNDGIRIEESRLISTLTHDKFVIEIFQDSQGRDVIIIYGYEGRGTLAGALTFYENYEIFNGNTGYWIYEWIDNPTQGTRTHPDLDDTYNLLTSGPAP